MKQSAKKSVQRKAMLSGIQENLLKSKTFPAGNTFCVNICPILRIMTYGIKIFISYYQILTISRDEGFGFPEIKLSL